MPILGPLLRSSFVALLLSQLVAAWMAVTVFPLTDEQAVGIRWSFALGLLVEIVAVAGALTVLTGRMRHALARPTRETDPASVAAAAHRLPAEASMVALLAGALVTAGRALVMERDGLPPDLALAAGAVGVAAAILGAMAIYALVGTTSAAVLVKIGPQSSLSGRGTVRGKILVVAFGLNTIALLLFAATGYVRYRADIDREYVAAAERAQASALATSAGGDAAAAEHVWLVTSAQTALLTPGGGVVSRHGSGDAPFALAQPVPGTQRFPGGWLVVSRTPQAGLVASWLPEEPLRARRRSFWASQASTGLLVYISAAVLAWLAARSITTPLRDLGRAADRIASGDLTVSPPSISRDEMGQLAADFRRMTQGLKSLVVDVRGASQGVSSGAREAGGIGDQVRRGALVQHEGLVSVQAAVEAMEGSVAMVSRGVGSLSDYVQGTTQAVGESAMALEEVRKKGAELDRAMDSALTDVESLAGAGREAEATLGELEDLAGHAGGTLASVKASVSALERAAGEAEVNAALVADMSERSGSVVEETVHGIETLRAAVSDAHRRITVLGRRSDDIDQVVDFISEVAGRTNLLSLNASIIAAQAGEHGKAFAVVADQIRDLAAQIARSTKSIGDIIHAVREDVEATAALIDRGDALAVEGVQLARNSLEALGQIQRTTAQGRDTAGRIRVAVEAHASSSREVALLVESVANGSRAVTSAVQLVGRSVAGVGAVSRSVNALAEQVSRALEDQAGLGRRQMESLSRLERMIADITRAVQNHDAATRRVHDSLGNLSHATGEHEGAVDGLTGVAERLGARARALTERIDRFRIEG